MNLDEKEEIAQSCIHYNPSKSYNCIVGHAPFDCDTCTKYFKDVEKVRKTKDDQVQKRMSQ